MSLHPSTFEYLQPTEAQIALMADAREAFRLCAERIAVIVPDGPDRTYLLRSASRLRDVGQCRHHPQPRRLTAGMTPMVTSLCKAIVFMSKDLEPRYCGKPCPPRERYCPRHIPTVHRRTDIDGKVLPDHPVAAWMH